VTDQIRVSLAVGEQTHTWTEEDVFVPVPGPGVGPEEEYLLNTAIEVWTRENPGRAVVFLTLIGWDYVDDDEQE
jgi:hypothetical protein